MWLRNYKTIFNFWWLLSCNSLMKALPVLTWSIARNFTVLNDLMENENLIFYKYFDLFPETIVPEIFCDMMISEKNQNINKSFLFIFHIICNMIKLLVILFINKLFAQLNALKKLQLIFITLLSFMIHSRGKYFWKNLVPSFENSHLSNEFCGSVTMRNY